MFLKKFPGFGSFYKIPLELVPFSTVGCAGFTWIFFSVPSETVFGSHFFPFSNGNINERRAIPVELFFGSKRNNFRSHFLFWMKTKMSAAPIQELNAAIMSFKRTPSESYLWDVQYRPKYPTVKVPFEKKHITIKYSISIYAAK